MPKNPGETDALAIDVVSDVVCPWCFIGKRRLENAIASRPDIPVAVRFRPYFLNPWVPREGISRTDYLTTKFGSVERYNQNAQRIVAVAASEGLTYSPGLIKRQPNTLNCHRLILWAEPAGDAASTSSVTGAPCTTRISASLMRAEIWVGVPRYSRIEHSEAVAGTNSWLSSS